MSPGRLDEGRPSATAYRVALQRAAHQVLDQPRVLDDPIALRIVGPRAEQAIRTEPRKFQSSYARIVRAFVVARARRAEDVLAESVAAGVRQYVVLGAGLDTFAYRSPYSEVRVFEVDHPATQTWKRDLLDRTRIPVPESLTLVSVDFELESLPDRLEACGFRADQPACFSWLGVTMYLTRGSIMDTFAFVGARPEGSSITFDYFVPLSHMSWIARLFFQLRAWKVSRAGEPWRTAFAPEELAAELRKLGFSRVVDLDAVALNERYFEHHQVLRIRHPGRIATGYVR